MVHRNRLKLDKKKSRGNCIERSEEKQPYTTTYEPGVLHQEIPAGTLVEPAPLRRSARNRRQPERYQDYDLMDVEIEDALR